MFTNPYIERHLRHNFGAFLEDDHLSLDRVRVGSSFMWLKELLKPGYGTLECRRQTYVSFLYSINVVRDLSQMGT
jgi:hypothetical protein